MLCSSPGIIYSAHIDIISPLRFMDRCGEIPVKANWMAPTELCFLDLVIHEKLIIIRMETWSENVADWKIRESQDYGQHQCPIYRVTAPVQSEHQLCLLPQKNNISPCPKPKPNNHPQQKNFNPIIKTIKKNRHLGAMRWALNTNATKELALSW